MALAMIAPAIAEMSDQDYRSGAGALPPAQRARIAAELQAARASEAEAAALREAQARARAQAQAEQRAQRPLGEQLLETRCATCHAPGLVDGARRGWLGWRWTVERMRWWYGAPLAHGEAAVIVRHLAQTRGPGITGLWREWGVALRLLVVVAIPSWLGWSRLRQRWTSAPG